MLEISLMLLIILGRWFLPKGSISRSTLSQLLLVYMSLASDIVDLLSLLNENQIQDSTIMVYTTLAIFSWSLFQFTLNLVVTRGRYKLTFYLKFLHLDCLKKVFLLFIQIFSGCSAR